MLLKIHTTTPEKKKKEKKKTGKSGADMEVAPPCPMPNDSPTFTAHYIVWAVVSGS
jgi:hypothetical protein